MRKIHRVLRLSFEAGLSIRAISRSIQASLSTVGDYIRRARTAGLSYPDRPRKHQLLDILKAPPVVRRVGMDALMTSPLV